MKNRILLVDDHKIIRQGLRTLIEKQPDLEVIAEAEDGRTAVHLTKELLPNVVIMDVTLPEMNGIEATYRITKACPGIKIIALSMHSDKHFVAEMFRAGASGYLPKDCAFEELIQAINTVLSNRSYISPHLGGAMVKEYGCSPEKVGLSVFTHLTSREREVLQLMAEGKSTKQIACILKISIKTIETHRQHIMLKLNLRCIADLVKYAIREGLASL